MVSVCLATYDGEKYIQEQLSSILVQLSPEDEIIVSDDSTSPLTEEIVRSYGDLRIHYIKNQGKHGVNQNFQNALIHSKGDVIFLSDQDDVWLPNKVKIIQDALRKYILVVHDCVVVDSELNVIEESYFQKYKSRPGLLKNIYRNTYIGACMAFRRELLEVTLPIPLNFPVYHDGWFAGIAELVGSVGFIDYKGILYRRHGANTSVSASKSNIPICRKIYNRVLWLMLVILRYIKIKVLEYKFQTN